MTKTFLATNVIIVFITTGCFLKKEHITVLFDRVDGLTEKSPVFNKGIQIGKIKRLDIFGHSVAVDLTIEKDIKIPVHSTFTIENSLLGGSYINIEYSNDSKFLAVRDTSYGVYQKKEALLDKIMSDSTKRKNIEQSLEKIATGIGELIESAKDTTKTYN